MYIMTMKGINNSKGIESIFPLWIGPIALILIFYLFKLFKRTSEIEKAKYVEEISFDDEFHNWTNQL